MAVSIWFSAPSKELKRLVRTCIYFTTQSRNPQHFKPSYLLDELASRSKYIAVNSKIANSTLNTEQCATTSNQRELSKCRERHQGKANMKWPSMLFHQRGLDTSIDCRLLSVGHQLTCRWLPGSGISTQPMRLFHGSSTVWAGHNKWSKVKHIKGPKDDQRSIVFNKLILQMRIAIRENGPNPELNSALAGLISQAKSKAMPKSTIEGVLKAPAKSADTQLLLEARGPGQSCLLIDVLTDNARRTRNEIQRILQKNGGDFGTSLYAFTRKGVVKVLPQMEGQEKPLTLDLAEEVAIEVGAEDVQETSNEDDTALFMFICDLGDLRTVRNNLASLNYAVESSSFEYLPETTIALNDKSLEDTFLLISLLNDNPNVVRVYDNVESSG
ncbi:translational activator of cytochrome c oxidase 1-like [Acanthaster planci]|uniref:Translational activator of cytochrome c oxidase 1 n=1 Tax=Acanthaster planci TaxID=133434 RepID=A0A8B7Y119_ACAPL|nr:translational activator of cytochrome c oxidase 1-like [Acanthaster planci]XP_022086231.1 translational activator of cytochrome c oxidase 1-like [Acanthaster planci]